MPGPSPTRAHSILAVLRAFDLEQQPLPLHPLTVEEFAEVAGSVELLARALRAEAEARRLSLEHHDDPESTAPDRDPAPVARTLATLRALYAAAQAVEYRPYCLDDLRDAGALLDFLQERISLALYVLDYGAADEPADHRHLEPRNPTDPPNTLPTPPTSLLLHTIASATLLDPTHLPLAQLRRLVPMLADLHADARNALVAVDPELDRFRQRRRRRRRYPGSTSP